MKLIKKFIIILYAAIIIIMGIATFIEHSKGTMFASTEIYGSWWFCALWGILTAAAVFFLIISRIRKFGTILLHASFVIILIGALTTHIFSIKGIIHLRKGEMTSQYMATDEKNDMKIQNLPFGIKLDKFDVLYYNGTTAAKDYISNVTVIDGKNRVKGKISMNNVFSYQSYRLYQNSYDDDLHGTYLTINSDPYGIAISYTGYALLFISLIWMLVNPKGTYRKLFKSPLLKKGLLSIILLFVFSPNEINANSLPDVSAVKFGKLDINYNNRICPIQTFAIDFTKKIYGSCSYKGFIAEQVLTGFIFWSNDWNNEPIINIKDIDLRERFGFSQYISLNQLFNKERGGYILGPLVQEYYQGNQDKMHKAVISIDDKVQLIMSLRQGEPLKIFPYMNNNNIIWLGPKDIMPKSMNGKQSMFIKNIFTLLNQSARTSNYKQFNDYISKIKIYQERNGGNSRPSITQIMAELTYNRIPFATILFIVNLTVGFLSLFYSIYQLTRKKQIRLHADNIISLISLSILIFSFLCLTYCEILRWIISGNIPMANGYETMLIMAWFVMLFSLIAYKRFHILITFGFLMSGFFLLVSHIGQMDPQITPIMPVLSSPLLSIHVSIIMMSFALLSLTFICGLMAIILFSINRISNSKYSAIESQLSSLCLLSRLFLYPAVATLGMGIFIGAIWANESWGQYWSWDPKEVWALITFMFYAVVLHTSSLPKLRKPLYYHAYITIAFLMILMTYFGVNYLLGGMHSYA
ncbi:MAG: cytochrome c biogenesis protein CcsA [Prevotella sp.]|nr:cytochrome c biogenesis protein CcsA [Prevotella sp.]